MRVLWPGCDGGGRRGVDAGTLMRAVRNVPTGHHGAETGQPEQEQADQIRRLHAQGWSQNRIIEELFGCKKGGSRAYHEARNTYRQVIQSIAPVGTGDDATEPEFDEVRL